MERGVRRKAVPIGPRAERLLAPVQEREGIGMREHDSLGLARRTRGEQDVSQVVLIERGGQGGGRVVGHDLGPQRITRIACGCLGVRGYPGLPRADVLGLDDDQPRQGARPRPGLAQGGQRSGLAITTALTPLAAKMLAARTAGPEGSTGT